MPQFLFDTDHLTLFQHKRPVLIQRLAQQPPNGVAICPINIEETMRGRLAVLNRKASGPQLVQAYDHLVAAEQMFRLFPIVPFDNASESRYQQLRAMKLGVGSQDLKIAAIALAHSLTVLTANTQDFGRVPGLIFQDWSV